jgi:hypothetical protein
MSVVSGRYLLRLTNVRCREVGTSSRTSWMGAMPLCPGASSRSAHQPIRSPPLRHPYPDPRRPRPHPEPPGSRGRRTAWLLAQDSLDTRPRRMQRQHPHKSTASRHHGRRAGSGGTASGGGSKPRAETVRLLGHDIPVHAADEARCAPRMTASRHRPRAWHPTSRGCSGTSRARIGMPWRPAIGARRASAGFWAISDVEPDHDRWLTCPPDGGVGRSSRAYRP